MKKKLEMPKKQDLTQILSYSPEGDMHGHYYMVEKDMHIDYKTGEELDEWLIRLDCPVCGEDDQIGYISEEPPDDFELLDILRKPCDKCVERYGEEEAKRLVLEKEKEFGY
ncbi:MAG: hypothetical protein JRI80_09590 [Deltaproteobacteria bacterium]|nr:hypothetical protein [Deltaproteobacteria bacterium]